MNKLKVSAVLAGFALVLVSAAIVAVQIGQPRRPSALGDADRAAAPAIERGLVPGAVDDPQPAAPHGSDRPAVGEHVEAADLEHDVLGLDGGEHTAAPGDGPTAAAPPEVQAGRPLIATIDLERVFNSSNQRAEAEIELEALRLSFEEKVKELKKEAELLKQDLELLVAGTDQYKKAEKRWIEAVLNFSAYTEFSKLKLDSMRTAARKRIHERIMKAAETYAVANHIGLVLADDSMTELQEGSDRQVIQQMSLRRVVYRDPEFDITDDLIDWLNDQEEEP